MLIKSNTKVYFGRLVTQIVMMMDSVINVINEHRFLFPSAIGANFSSSYYLLVNRTKEYRLGYTKHWLLQN